MTINYYLTGRCNRHGECEIKVSVRILKRRIGTTIGFVVAPRHWDSVQQRVVSGKVNSKNQSSEQVNEFLKNCRLRLQAYERECYGQINNEQLVSVIHGAEHKVVTGRSIKVCFSNYLRKQSAIGQWTNGMIQSAHAFQKHLEQHCGSKTMEYFNDGGIDEIVSYLRYGRKLTESSVQKYYKILRAFLNWSEREDLYERNKKAKLSPKFKMIEQPVIFLTKEELIKLCQLRIPSNGAKVVLYGFNGKTYEKTVSDASALEKTRDLFTFCALTGLRYSDMSVLKRTDIIGDTINIVTQKTGDRLTIELSMQAKAILAKYNDKEYPGNLALPVISNQKMNDYLKELGELCGFNTPITKTYVRAGVRETEVYPKWRLLSTHAARRTFICFAISTGIPPQVVMKWTGHSDYKSMRPYIEIAEKTKAEAMKTISDALMK